MKIRYSRLMCIIVLGAILTLTGLFSTNTFAVTIEAESIINISPGLTADPLGKCRGCSTAFASDGLGAESDADGREANPLICTAGASIGGSSAQAGSIFPNGADLGSGAAFVRTGIDGSADGRTKADGFPFVVESDLQIDFQIDYTYDSDAADGMALYGGSLWSGATPKGDVLREHILLEEKDGWVYSNIRDMYGNDFYVLAKAFTIPAVLGLTTVWSDIDLFVDTPYGIYSGIVSAVGSDSWNKGLLPTYLPEPATISILGLGGLALLRWRRA